MRTSPITAAIGTAISSPTKPNSEPKASSANISQTGCTPIESPTNFGWKMLPSRNCPAALPRVCRNRIVCQSEPASDSPTASRAKATPNALPGWL